MNVAESSLAVEGSSITLVDLGIGALVIAGLAYGFKKVYQGILGKSS